MAFLAINNIKVEAQLGSLISTALALSSIITAQLQIRQHRGTTGAQSHEVVSSSLCPPQRARKLIAFLPTAKAQYLDSVEGRYFGLLPLAINYSLPYALLLWSVAWFGVAILFFAVPFWSYGTGKATILAMTVMVISPILWSSIFAWHTHDEGFQPSWRYFSLPEILSWPFSTGSSSVPPSPKAEKGSVVDAGEEKIELARPSESSSSTEIDNRMLSPATPASGTFPTKGRSRSSTWTRTLSRFSLALTGETAHDDGEPSKGGSSANVKRS